MQSIVTLSTTEAEYVAAVSAGQEIVWMRQLLSEMGYSFNAASKLLTDNQSALSVAKHYPMTAQQYFSEATMLSALGTSLAVVVYWLY